jgi:hypothetical protein
MKVIFPLVVSVLCAATSFSSAPAWAQSASTTPEELEAFSEFPNAGGSYNAVSRGSFDLFKEGVNTNDIANNPEVSIHFEAGAWGSGGNEPMVFVYVDSHFGAVPPADYLRPPIPTVGYARVPCVRDVDVHCECIRPDPDECYHFTIAAAAVRRPYRIVNMSGMMLPGNVSFIPVLVDYRVNRGVRPTTPLPDDQGLFNYSAKVSLRYPSGQSSFVRSLDCTPSKCVTFSMNPAPSEGSFEVPVTVGAADELLLDVSAVIYVNDLPDCVTVSTAQGDMCLVPPYGGEAWVHVDPYVYVDPSWEYADWFEVQTTADEAGTQWVEAQRTNVDLSTFGIDGGGGSAGTGGAGGSTGAPDGGVPDGGTAGTGGTAGSDGSPNGGSSSGGCSVAISSSPSSHLPLLLLFMAAATAPVRRSRFWPRSCPSRRPTR